MFRLLKSYLRKYLEQHHLLILVLTSDTGNQLLFHFHTVQKPSYHFCLQTTHQIQDNPLVTIQKKDHLNQFPKMSYILYYSPFYSNLPLYYVTKKVLYGFKIPLLLLLAQLRTMHLLHKKLYHLLNLIFLHPSILNSHSIFIRKII